MSATITDRVDTRSIIRDGKYYILENYALRNATYSKVVNSFLDSIGALEGAACREHVAASGLGQLHRYFPVEKIYLLERLVMQHLRDDLYYWSFRVGRDTLGLEHPFYIDHLIVIRIHYPFLVAREAKSIVDPPYPISDRLRLAGAALKNIRMLRNYVGRLKARWRAKRDKSITFNVAAAYHRNLPIPAQAHGPHIDTWYGHSYDGINLWWSIDGVNEDNTVILYPDMFGQALKYDPVSMYIAPGVSLRRPHKIAMAPGELLVFNPETLHSTQVNISDETRVAISTRLNPATPRFNSKAPFNFEYWFCSQDLARRKFSAMSVFPAKKYHGEPSITQQPAAVDEKTVRLQYSGLLMGQTPVAVCSAGDLRTGVKVAVNLENAKILLWRDGGAVRAFSRLCPHLGIDLADGFHDPADKKIYCPGHGVAYSLSDGSSRCAAFKLREYPAYENNGQIYVQAN